MPVRDHRNPPQIPGYRLERPLGEGGMATAWLAVQLSLGREVALKVLDPVLAADAAFVERFVREARLLAQLRHRHIVAIHDVGVADGQPYLAMEYVPGGSILPLCGHCDAATALRCVREIALALGHAHERGIVHRDVKPENILSAEDGSFVLGDFGIARVSEAGALAAATAPGLAFGTPAYMAPERWRDQAVDGRSDFYALGCVLHALLTGRPPYAASEQVALGHKHLNDPIPLLPDAFALLQGLLARLLAKDPAERHPDATALAAHVQALERELAGDDLPHAGDTRLLSEWPFGAGSKLLEPATPTARPAPPTGARSRLAWFGLGLGALAIAGLVFADWLSRDRRPGPPPPPPVVAVLPFTVEGDDADLGRLADVLSEELNAKLARVPRLSVTARGLVLANAQRGLQPVAMADSLKADRLVVGGLRRGGDGSYELTLQLLDGRNGASAWSATRRGSFDGLWRLQQEIAGQLLQALVPDAAAAPVEGPSVSLSDAANTAYLRGRQLMVGSVEAHQLREAMDAFEEALRIDPHFAVAQAGKCRAGLRLFAGTRNARAFEPARAACEEAARLDPGAAEVVVALGDLHRMHGDHARAMDYYGRVANEPAVRAEALFGLANSADALDRIEEAERYIRRAQGLLPGYWRVHAQAGNFYMRRSRYDEAVTAYRTAIALAGDSASAIRINLGIAYLATGRLVEAEATNEAALAHDRSYAAVSNLGNVRFYLGNYASAAELYAEAISRDPDDYRPRGNLADALSMLPGRAAEAREQYRQAADLAEQYLAKNNDSVDAATELVWFWINCGEVAKARSLLEAIRERPVDDGLVALRMASSLAVLGDAPGSAAMVARVRQLGLSDELVAATPWLGGRRP